MFFRISMLRTLRLCYTRKLVLRTHLSVLPHSQTRASHSFVRCADGLLVNRARKTNAASRRLFFFCAGYIVPYLDADVHQNYIRPNLLYVLVGDTDIRLTAQDT